MTNSNPSHPHAERVEQREGVVVECAVCGNMKKPVGRSAPIGPIYCDEDCRGYHQPPYVGSLWPGEASEQFGYPVGPNGTRVIAAVRAEGAPALEVQRQKESENDLGAGLIHQIASPLAETEPRLTIKCLDCGAAVLYGDSCPNCGLGE